MMDAAWHSITFGQSTDLNFDTGILPEKRGLSEVRTIDDGIEIESRGGKLQPAHDGLSFYYCCIPATADFTLTADLTLLQLGPENGAAANGQEGCGIMLRDILGPARQNSLRPGFEEYPASSNFVMLRFAPSDRKANCPIDLCAAFRDGVVHPGGNPGIHYHSTLLENAVGTPLSDDPANRYRTRLHCSLMRSGEKLSYAYATEDPTDEKPSPLSSGDFPLSSDILQVLDQKTIYAGFFAARNACMKVEHIKLEIDARTSEPASESASEKRADTDRDLYASPSGSEEGGGTAESPLSLSSALRMLRPGQTVFLLPGIYQPMALTKEMSGLPGRSKKVRCLGAAVLRPDHEHHALITLDSDYWDFSGLELDGQGMEGVSGWMIHGHHNQISDCSVHHTCPAGRDAGFCITTLRPDRTEWPSFNCLIDCRSYENHDLTRQNADGFACRSGAGEGNQFIRCIAHHNCDDGFDLYTNISRGPGGAVRLEHCIAYANEANGFKLGGEGQECAHQVTNCLAFSNGLHGFSDNFNPGALHIENNIAYDNTRSNFLFRPSPYKLDAHQKPSSDCILKGNLSFRTADIVAEEQHDYVCAAVNEGNHFL